MTFLPIVGRELRVASRRRATFWIRSAAVLSVILVGVAVFASMFGSDQKSIGSVLFGNISGAAVLYCLFSGVRATADSVSEEKRDGTLGLLFLTDLKGYDVVLGKLAGTSLNAIYGVLAVIPVMAVPLLMGGVTVGEFGRMAVVALNTLFFSLSAGLLVSSLSRSARAAIVSTFALIVSVAGLLPALGAILGHVLKKPQLQPFFLVPSPGYTFYMGFAIPFKNDPHSFWSSAGTIHILAWLFLGFSALIAPRSWQDKPAGAQRLRWRERWAAWSYGNPQQRAAFRARLLDTNAYYWLAARARLKPAIVWAVLGLLACGWVWGLVKYGRDWLEVGFFFATGIILNLLIKTWFASEAGRQFVEDRKQGSLELVLSTSLSVRDILRGERLALQRQFLGPVIAIITAGVLLMIATGRELKTDADAGFWQTVWLAGLLMLIADLAALYWVGMWQALVARHPNRATGGTISRVLVLPWLVFFLVCLLLPLARNQLGEPEKFLLGLWLALGLAADAGFGIWARYKLLSEFRLIAAHGPIRKASLWKRMSATAPRPPTQLQPAKIES